MTQDSIKFADSKTVVEQLLTSRASGNSLSSKPKTADKKTSDVAPKSFGDQISQAAAPSPQRAILNVDPSTFPHPDEKMIKAAEEVKKKQAASPPTSTKLKNFGRFILTTGKCLSVIGIGAVVFGGLAKLLIVVIPPLSLMVGSSVLPVTLIAAGIGAGVCTIALVINYVWNKSAPDTLYKTISSVAGV